MVHVFGKLVAAFYFWNFVRAFQLLIRIKDEFYTWYEPDANKNGGFAGNPNGERNTYAYTNTINVQGLCGAKDWRLPTKGELENLVYCSDDKKKTLGKEESGYICTGSPSKPTINTIYFPDQNGYHPYFHSSSPYANDYNFAWNVNFYGGSSTYISGHGFLIKN